MIAGLEGPNPALDAVQGALQQAIELEHATIPVYLYALYSLDAAKNKEIAAIIQSVVIEEMLHMTLASNVLNAIGGSPVIDQPSFIPTYPGPLPGGVESSLTVNLAPFSMTQLQTFLDIEQPENPLDFNAVPAESEGITIGQFYGLISLAIKMLGERIFTGSRAMQIGPELMHNSVVVSNVMTAQWAIATIVQQGEGNSDSPKAVVGGGYAHYYRFMQIQKGALLIQVSSTGNPDTDYKYAGAPVPFDATGVYAVPTNPALTPYAKKSQQAVLNDTFNYTYTSLLVALHAMFNGQAEPAEFRRAVGLMMSLKEQARAMMSGIPNPAIFTGPSFQYQPTNPAS
jgi:rubrerythrin